MISGKRITITFACLDKKFPCGYSAPFPKFSIFFVYQEN